MKVRLEGLPKEVDAYTAALRKQFEVRRETGPYRNRPPSPLVRRYLDIRFRDTAAAAQDHTKNGAA